MSSEIPLVVDIYHLDGVNSFNDAFNAGVRGVIHKASTGKTGKDGAYADRRKAAIKAGLLWGAYHWGTGADVKGQVDNFLKCAAPDDTTLVSLDYETTKGNQMTLDQARDFLSMLGEKLGRKPIIYSGNVLKSALGNKKDAFFGSHRLWLAQYGPTAVVQASWTTYWLWQYTDGKKTKTFTPPIVPGLPGNSKGQLDCDRYNGSADQLKIEWAS